MPASANAGSLNRCPGARLIAWALVSSGNGGGAPGTILAGSGFASSTAVDTYTFQLNLSAAQTYPPVVDIVQGGNTPGNSYLKSCTTNAIVIGMAAVAAGQQSTFYLAVYGP